jgi:hypothetical protein
MHPSIRTQLDENRHRRSVLSRSYEIKPFQRIVTLICKVEYGPDLTIIDSALDELLSLDETLGVCMLLRTFLRKRMANKTRRFCFDRLARHAPDLATEIALCHVGAELVLDGFMNHWTISLLEMRRRMA